MFQSYAVSYLGYDKEKDLWNFEATIIDDDFVETASGNWSATPPGNYAAASIAVRDTAFIEIYSRRNLNVAKNLWLLLEHHYVKWGKRERHSIIEYWQQHIPQYSQYHDDVLFYLTFT